ncbi:MAG: hypothetical protein EU539_07075 [Promethearchaeota archaeon]|nr:MAG: hypothetical protein EU539_07075 [Candidatus Lokiarchaeota archaeon]
MTVIIPKKAYLTVVAACVRFANQKIPRDKWLEVSGIFIGKNEKNRESNVIISEAHPIMHQTYDPEAIVDKYVWSDEDMVSLSIIDEQAFNKGEFVIGWWHSHPGFKVMLSEFGDRRTTVFYQSNNPLAIALVFNPERLTRQIEAGEKMGDPVKQLKNDPGFKIFRLEDGNDEKSNFIEVDYRIEGFDNMEELVKETQKFIIDITNFFPKDDLFKKYESFIDERITRLNSLIIGTEEYLKTLIRQGERNRVPEVLDNQKKEIRRFVAETFIKVGNIKEYMNFLEYKERETTIPMVHEILSRWDQTISKLDERLNEISNKF